MYPREPDDQPQLVPPATAPRDFREVVAGLEVAAIDAVEEARRARSERAAEALAAEGVWLRRLFRRLG